MPAISEKCPKPFSFIAIAFSCFFLMIASSLLAQSRVVVDSHSAIWKRHTIDDTSRGADGVKLGDVNGDGRFDIVTGWEEGGEVRLYLNPGPIDSKKAWPRVTVGMVKNAEDAILADLDRDGRLDVISCTEGKTRTVYWHRFEGDKDHLLLKEGWTTEVFPATSDKQMWMQAIAMDVDQQNGNDLILASKNKDATIGWLQAPRDSHQLDQWRYHALREASWIMSLALHDIDEDGDLDLLFSDRKGKRSGVFWLDNPGPASNAAHDPWKEHLIGAEGREVMFVDWADINGDQIPEVIAAVKPVDILVFSKTGSNKWSSMTLTLESEKLGDAKAVKSADLNRDGLVDLLFSCENAKSEREGIVWMEQSRDGTWRQHSLGGPEGVKFDLIQVIDLDQDGDLDVLTCEERDQLGVVWYENPTSAQ